MVSLNDKSVANARALARAVIVNFPDISYAEGRFLGSMAFATKNVSDNQIAWLRDLYLRHGGDHDARGKDAHA